MSTTRSSISTSSGRRVKWYATPPPPSPKIINLPRSKHSGRRRKQRPVASKRPMNVMFMGHGNNNNGNENEEICTYNYKGKVEGLFGVEGEFTRDFERRERVVEEEGEGGVVEEEKWRFQAEILRAECNYLRMERKFALKKLEKNRVRIERTLKSALQNLASGRKKLCEGKNMEAVLEEEMKELAEKLEELQSSYNESEDHELKKCKNFDKKALRLQRRLEKLGGLTDDECNKEVKKESNCEGNADSSTLNCKSQIKSTDVQFLERKMEGLSKGMLDRMEKDFGSILSSSVASSASTSKRIEFPDHLSFSNRFPNHTKDPSATQEGSNKCSGRCKVLVRRIVEQVRAETEQWSQMQEMLGQLRQEMEELQTSKDFWENQALGSNNEIHILQLNVEEWMGKAIEYEKKTNKLQKEVDFVKGELEKMKKDQGKEIASTPKKATMSLGKQIERETKNGLSCRMMGQCNVIGSSKRHEKVEPSKKDPQPLSLGKQLAREKRILISRLKENRPANNEISSDGRRKGFNLVRSPFRDIGNSTSSTSTIVRQNSNAIFPLHCPEDRIEDIF